MVEQSGSVELIEQDLADLKDRVAQLTQDGEQAPSAIPALSLYRKSGPTEPVGGLYEPSICMVLQGAKRVMLGRDVYVYDAQRYLITSTHLPTDFQIIEASPQRPYLGLKLVLDLREVSQLMVDSRLPAPRSRKSGRGMAIGVTTAPLIQSFVRLLSLLDAPQDLPILAPLIQREITYRLLVGDQGMRLRHIASMGSQSHQIARSIEWLKEHFRQPLRIESLSRQFDMSPSTFHNHFRAMTAMSPLQYQKWLRLHEARRLMLAEDQDASTAAFNVGYESPSQFSREYSRLFGAPPLRDIVRLRNLPA
ncbi:AraC family transcriptional regulator [Acidihalobacter ferrooxydans]|uniref:AraC family transcriptional regulator n=1 Tax=Acidihalobacter ferrooxydans TaxID=1765967 RepID=A0A1P8UDT8_9GAMM|nr:AraC family transcriptional regulator [Acidihalobacter ferrooxydans]APZ41980.1 AraC family transcriptional regulator [Acidihalobacter ferrooxydans]